MEILILFVLTCINGIFALSEIALVSVKKNRIEQKAQQGSSNARVVLELLEHPENFLSSIQVGITLIGVVAGAYGGTALADDVEPLVRRIPWLADYAEGVSATLIVGFITYFTIVIGELIPKSIALRNTERVALTFAPFIRYFSRITYPVVRLLSLSTSTVLRLLGIRESQEERLTEDELRQMIKSAGSEGVLAREESQMHQNLFNFAQQRAKNLKTHRTEVEWIDIRQPPESVSSLIKHSVHSRFLVCRDSVDQIVGIIDAEEFFLKRHQPSFRLEDILHDPLYVPETMFALDILALFKTHKQYLAVVVDEYGSVEGIVTLHDLMEGIVGDLPDLDEEDEPDFVVRQEGSFLVNGSVLIHDLNNFLDKELITENVDHFTTLGGFVIYHLNKIPDTGERFTYNGYDFEVVDLDGQRVDKVIITEAEVPAS